MKRNFIHHKRKKRHGKSFWDNEYANAEHLQLSEEVSEDLEKFTRFLIRTTGKQVLNPTNSVVDFGCGNGRNLVYLAREFGLHGVGYDISDTAVKQARQLAAELQLHFAARSMTGTFELADNSQILALDMMASHFLNQAERLGLRNEIYRVLKPGGWLFMKTFLRDGDLHTKRLLAEHGTEEDGSYIHPVIGEREYVYWESDLVEFLESGGFTIAKIYRSHKHISRGKANKRRTVSIYAQKPEF